MAMSKAKLKTYTEKWLRLKGDAQKLQDALDGETNLSEPERLEVFKAIQDAPDPEPPHPDKDIREQEQNRLDPKRKNNTLDLREYDFHNEEGFRGDAFKKYREMVEGVPDPQDQTGRRFLKRGLDRRKQYTFERYDVRPIFVHTYPGMQNSPTRLDGIIINLPKPLSTTFITVEHATLLNAQVQNAQARSAGTVAQTKGLAFYYLLKKD